MASREVAVVVAWILILVIALLVVAALSYLVDHATAEGPPRKYKVKFTEDGLPSMIEWTVTLTGSGVNSSHGARIATIVFKEKSGVYDFTVHSVKIRKRVFTPSPGSGMVTANGTLPPISITFTS